MTTIEILQKAKRAAPSLAMLDTDTKNKALLAMADSITEEKESILEANRLDVESAQKKMNDVMIDRLCLTEQRIMAMSEGIKQVAALPDPVFEIMESHARPNGLIINKVRVPMGVVAIIYESRPNVTSDAAALSLKSGNVCVLRGGKEA